jgi:hypothetical protein
MLAHCTHFPAAHFDVEPEQAWQVAPQWLGVD